MYECCYIAEGKNILIVASLWDSPILDRKFVQENKRHENVYNDTQILFLEKYPKEWNVQK